MISRTIVINPIEPALLSARSPLGVDLDLDLTFVAQSRAPVDPETLKPQLALLPRSRGGVGAYDVETTSSTGGTASVSVPGTALVDAAGYSIELYSRRAAVNPADPPVPNGLLARGVLRLEGDAYASWGPLSPVAIPVVVGPPGPMGPQGIGVQGEPGTPGERGSIWWTGNGDPSTPPPLGTLTNDMYLDQSSGNVWTWTGVDWVATAP